MKLDIRKVWKPFLKINKNIPLIAIFTITVFYMDKFMTVSNEILALISFVFGAILANTVVQSNEGRDIVIYMLGLTVAGITYLSVIPAVGNLVYSLGQSFLIVMLATLFWICIVGLYNKTRR